MRIGINASFIRKPNTGIGQVSFNFLQKLKESGNYNVSSIKQDIEFVLYLEEDISLDLPSNFRKRVFLPLWKRDDLVRKIWWEKFLLPKKVKEDGCEAFISLYQNTTILHNMVVKHIMLVHDIIPKLFSEYLNNFRKKIYWKLTEKAIKKADKIISVSKRTKKDLMRHLDIPEEKIKVNYIDVAPIYKREVDKEESKRVLKKYNLEKGYIYFGGGLEKRKNAARLLKAYKLLLKKFPISQPKNELQVTSYKLQSPSLVISGKLMPELSPLVTDAEKLVKELGLQNKVKILGFVPQEDLPALYKNASIFVYPSLYEGFGLPVLEAMNCGTAVICSNASSLPEVGGEAVEYFNPKDEKELAEKMKKVLNDNNLRNELSAKGKKQAEKFSWDRFIEEVIQTGNKLPHLPAQGESAIT